MASVRIDGEHLSIDEVVRVAQAWRKPETATIELAGGTRELVRRAQEAVERFVAQRRIVYGVTTGFGCFKDRVIPPDQVAQLQRNIVMSHSVGVGELLDQATVRALMLVRANTLARGHSGIREETLDALIAMINRGVYPCIPCKGSLGASGDLAPLAHMALVMIGEGEAFYRGERLPGGEAMRRAGLSDVKLGAKEGLALTNGTAMMAAVAALVISAAQRLARAADIAGAMSLEALHGTPRAFDAVIHTHRPHPGQGKCAKYVRRLIEESQFLRDEDPLDVQDAYTLRCIPQVHGAVRDTIEYAFRVIEIELNSTTDNPLIFFSDDGDPFCVSAGNFHGEPIALVMDFLAIALTDLGNMSERRLTRLTDDASNRGTLPAFLISHGGLNSGFMLAQYTAAALTSENKVLAHPASVDTIPTSANMEDHVSMGPIAARQAQEILRNVEYIIAIELLAAAQGIDFRSQIMGGPREMGRGTRVAYELIRRRVPFLERDAIMYPYIESLWELVNTGELVEAVDAALSRSRMIRMDE
jgi:histidine ammonia-lyase